MLSISLFAPALTVLLEISSDVTIAIEQGEEDKGKKNAEKELEKEELQLAFQKDELLTFAEVMDADNKHYIIKNQQNDGQVTLQPPELLFSPLF